MPARDHVRASLFENHANWTIQFPDMSTDTAQFQLEGTWEEIVQKHKLFAGRRVRVTVLTDEDEQRRLHEAAKRLFAQWDAEGPVTNPRPLQGNAAEFAEGVAEKLRKQGFKS
jgi:hypothetical protein